MPNPSTPTWLHLFRRMDRSSQNAIALMVRDGAILQVNHVLGIVDATDFIDDQFFSQMAGYGPWLRETTLRYYQ